MSTIFNMFNNMNENRLSTTEHLKETRSINQTGGIIAKSFDYYKPKGLSIRSKSDQNIPTTSSAMTFKKDGTNNSFFSKNELPNKQLLYVTNEFSKAGSFEFNKEKIIEKNIFKEPYIEEKEKRRIFPEPEVLAPYYDPELELDDYNIDLENEFSKCMLHVRDDMDEGFGSEPEELSYHEIPKLELSMHFSNYEFERCGSPDLPEISDDETF
ncbi:uncharacterized protein LOC124948558 [Vespa velutina]|uniref:uncharacterized protein LOC124948558 n=1 Tax=Vespa velutina TaxID=202808 RepID=UPI001FB2B73C|nr:uncharacterized protein LOC124948558 [Vespa velutina]